MSDGEVEFGFFRPERRFSAGTDAMGGSGPKPQHSNVNACGHRQGFRGLGLMSPADSREAEICRSRADNVCPKLAAGYGMVSFPG
jgi:hypothetical protein